MKSKLNFQQPFLLSSVSHDSSEIVLKCWFTDHETFPIINVENSFVETWCNFSRILRWMGNSKEQHFALLINHSIDFLQDKKNILLIPNFWGVYDIPNVSICQVNPVIFIVMQRHSYIFNCSNYFGSTFSVCLRHTLLIYSVCSYVYVCFVLQPPVREGPVTRSASRAASLHSLSDASSDSFSHSPGDAHMRIHAELMHTNTRLCINHL